MANPKEHQKPQIQGREPKKKTQGTFDNLRQLPQPHPVEELLGLVPSADRRPVEDLPPPTTTNQGERLDLRPPTTTQNHAPPTTTNQPPPPTTNQSRERPIAPARDFARVANSTIRDAIPNGLFKGTSKKLYDALYLRTRGAVVPTRKIRATQADLMDWAAVSHNTLRAHVRHLAQVGLLKKEWERGDNDGAIYEILIPEEIDLLPPPPTTTQYYQVPPATSSQNLGGPTNQKMVVGGGSYPASTSTTYQDPKTLSKTFNCDDEAAHELVIALSAAAEELTGSRPSPAEREKWAELGEVIAEELRSAASRTKSVSSVPAFLTAHLLRCFASRRLREDVGGARKSAPGEKGNSGAVDEGPRDLTGPIEMMRELIERGGYTREMIDEQFKGGFGPEDWQTITESLKT
jgi:hypothetical protein